MGMNTKTPPATAAELLAEWKRVGVPAECFSGMDDSATIVTVKLNGRRSEESLGDVRKKYAKWIEIAAQLDQMCEDDGIYTRDGFPQFRNIDGQTIIGKDGPLSLQELRIRLEWLLIKEQRAREANP